MEISVSEQALDFLLACLLGVGLGVLYDVFRIIRLALWHGKLIVAIQDILFWTAAAVCTFLFQLVNSDGQIRFYILLGELLGFTVYYFTVGILVFSASRLIIDLIKRILRFLYRILIRPFVKVFVFIFQKIKALFVHIISKCKKLKHFCKIRLHKKDVSLYNQNSFTESTGKVRQNAKRQRKTRKKKEKKT